MSTANCNTINFPCFYLILFPLKIKNTSTQEIPAGHKQSTHRSNSELKKKPLLRYQRAKTLDLSEYIMEHEKPITKMNIGNINAIQFNKFDRTNQEKENSLYLTENNRIRLTLGKYDDEHQSKPSTPTTQIVKNESASSSKEKSPNSESILKNRDTKPNKEDLLYLAENNRIRLTLGKFDDEQPNTVKNFTDKKSSEASKATLTPEPATLIPKKTKSILKSPTNMAERTIFFDDHINVISIDSSSSIPTNSSRLSPSSYGLLRPNAGKSPFE